MDVDTTEKIPGSVGQKRRRDDDDGDDDDDDNDNTAIDVATKRSKSTDPSAIDIVSSEQKTPAIASVTDSVSKVAAATPTNAAAAQQPVRVVPTVEKLRMPSAHTPGKDTTIPKPPRYSNVPTGDAKPPAAASATTNIAPRRIGLVLDTPQQQLKEPVVVDPSLTQQTSTEVPAVPSTTTDAEEIGQEQEEATQPIQPNKLSGAFDEQKDVATAFVRRSFITLVASKRLLHSGTWILLFLLNILLKNVPANHRCRNFPFT